MAASKRPKAQPGKKQRDGMGLAKTFLAIGIAIILALFVGYGVSVVFESPRYSYEQSDCYTRFPCEKQIEECEMDATHNYTIPSIKDCYREYTQTTEYRACQEQRDACEAAFQRTTVSYRNARTSFFVLAIIGIAAIIAGVMLSGLEGIGPGFMGGGVLIIIWTVLSTWQYWFSWSKYLKLLVLGIVLALLVYLGYKKLEKK